MKPVIDLSKEYGIVLEGGGAKGAYQIGAWKALKEAGLRIRGVSGTSVGALNGAMMCMGDIERAEKVWENIAYSQVMDVDDDLMKQLFEGRMNPGEAVRRGFELMSEGGMDVTPLRRLIDECVDIEKLLASETEFYICTFNVDEMKELTVDIRQEPPELVKDMLLASAYIFPLFKNEKLHGKTYIDGGIIDNVPIKPLLDQGYREIIKIRIFGIGRERPVKPADDVTIYSIEPRIDLGNIMDFDSEKSRRNITAGYYDAMRFLYGLEGIIYYIDGSEEEADYLRRLAGLHRGSSSLRYFLEIVLPKTALELKLSEWDYKKLYLAMLEATAKLCRVPKYKIYTVDELLGEVRKQRAFITKERKNLPAFAEMILGNEEGEESE